MANLSEHGVDSPGAEPTPTPKTTQSALPTLAPTVLVPSLLLVAATFMVGDPIDDLLSLLGGGESSPRKGRW